jgi:hypothetical protein
MKMKTTSNKNHNKMPALLMAVTLVAVMSVAAPFATAEVHPNVIKLANLAGSWQATLIGQGGCGFGSKLLTFTMNASGDSTTGNWSSNTTGCGTSSVALTVTITSLNSDGSGTARLEAGSGVFHFNIQVNPTSNVFNLVDITDSANYEEGTAVKQ